MHREILDFLKRHDVEYKENLKLRMISPARIGAEADFVVYPKDIEELVLLVSFLENDKIKHKIVGRMSNLLPPDEKYDGVIIRSDRLSRVDIRGQEVRVYCGVGLIRLSRILCEGGLSGLEELSGIPGSVGGAIIGNAGAFGRDISDCLTEVTLFDYQCGEIYTLPSSEIGFSYRGSTLSDLDATVLEAVFRFTSDSVSAIKERIDSCRRQRIASQPIDLPSLGSTFKRPSADVYAARLIDDCGLKGYRIGGAQVSEKHAGFIVNTGTATARDYLDLLDYVGKIVFERFGIKLEREIEIIKGG